jgi:hypothetical protein
MKTILILAALSSSSAFAGSCPQVTSSFSADVLGLAQEAVRLDALWDQLDDHSEASRRAEELKDDSKDFHGVMFRKDCDDLVEDFQEIEDDFRELRQAINANDNLSRRRDVAVEVLQFQAKLNRVAVDVSRL